MGRTIAVVVSLVALAATSCSTWREAPPEAAAPLAGEAAPKREMPEGAAAPLFNDLGSHHHPVTTQSALAQRYFDQGLILAWGFNHAEAARSFREAARLDPGCAMCFWGESLVLGPNINKPMDPADAPAAWAAVQKARAAAEGVSPKEQALIEALATRYAETAPADRSALDRAYAEAMARVAKDHPDDLDVQALYIEAVMDTMPWDYYRPDGQPKPETEEVVALAESVLARHPEHPGAIHLYIHLVEPSYAPGRAEAAADRLRDLVPGAGHLVHMPAHIYLRVGRYHDASIANEKAAAADESYITQCRAQGFYPAAYYPHNIHFLWAAASFEGRSELALDAAHRLVGAIEPGMVREAPFVEEFLPTVHFALARFGRWEEILAQPAPPEDLRYATGVWHYARGLALAATGHRDEAEGELAALRASRDGWATSDLVFQSGSTPAGLLTIGEKVLEARIAGADGRWDDAVAPLREAVERQDALPYTEPPPWYFPVREALGHALLEAGRPAAAESVFRKQLEKTPRNGWSLLGLVESLRAQGLTAAAADVERQRAEAWRLADVELPAPVF